MKARLVCAWCKKILKEIDTSDGSDSHGICNECADKENEKIKHMKSKLPF